MQTFYDFTEIEMSGQSINFKDYQGQVVLLMNTASKCGFAPQLTGFEELYQQYHDQGLAILGLPSNQFHQELKTDKETAEYCAVHYGVTFPMTHKIRVNGADADPLFTYLKEQTNSGRISWNFTKFLIDRNGQVVKRYSPRTKPEEILPDILAELKK
ncbi:glutathione peroxidase [Lentilactobacillus senioris]|uniref:glutathione peroxidase n=1 Tax=Lentilactobacillus senioris TaxID=931534 RepID=UPI003D2981ED